MVVNSRSNVQGDGCRQAERDCERQGSVVGVERMMVS